MTYKETAIKVLKESNKPLTAKEICEYATSKGYLSSKGKTPEATFSAVINKDIKDNPASPFFWISSSPYRYFLKEVCLSMLKEKSMSVTDRTAEQIRTAVEKISASKEKMAYLGDQIVNTINDLKENLEK